MWRPRFHDGISSVIELVQGVECAGGQHRGFGLVSLCGPRRLPPVCLAAGICAIGPILWIWFPTSCHWAGVAHIKGLSMTTPKKNCFL